MAKHFEILTRYQQDYTDLTAYFEDIDRLNLPIPREQDESVLRMLYTLYKEGVLAVAGGVYDQPEFYQADMVYMSNLEYYYQLPRLIEDVKDDMTRITAQQMEDRKRGTS